MEAIKQEIEKLKSKIGNKTLPESAKGILRQKLAKLEKELADKMQDTNKGMVADAEKKIKEVEKKIADPKIPAKEKAQIKEKLKETKKKVVEAQKETKKVEKTTETTKTTSSGKRGRPKKEVEKSIPKTKRKLETTLQKLKNLIKKTEKLNEKYTLSKQAKKVGDIDLVRDAKIPAKPFGLRVKGKGVTRKPTAADRKAGLVYSEKRPNRADVFPKRAIKL